MEEPQTASCEDQPIPRVQIDWDRSVWWCYPLLMSVRPAVRFVHLLIAIVAIELTRLGVHVAEQLFAPNWSGPLWNDMVARGATWHGGTAMPPFWTWMCDVASAVVALLPLSLRDLAFLTFCALWLALVWGMLGGLIVRRALFDVGQRTSAMWGEALRILVRRVPALLWLVGIYFVGIGLLLIPAWLGGLMARMGTAGAMVGGVGALVFAPLAIFLGRLLLGIWVATPLGVCAIAAEKKGDAFEGFSRGYAYFFQRPVLFVLLLAVLIIVGLVGEQLVYFVYTYGWQWWREAVVMGAGGTPSEQLVRLLSVGDWLVVRLIASYWFSFGCCAAAVLYLILRKEVDGIELDELFMLDEGPLSQVPSIADRSSRGDTFPSSPESERTNAAEDQPAS
ncbi:MAG: hypothetical protein KatS3mg111_1351 [Pirellulaceae bacterium]|nr:MAG: hypothetical protein KatS3mg111_1351 [Pirellulaceae bacterium]